MAEYIEREAAIVRATKGLADDFDAYDVKVNLQAIPAADVTEVRHAHWVKRMEDGRGNGYEAFTPVWSCSDCGKDYDPATCSIIKYCFECGAKMDGGQEDA